MKRTWILYLLLFIFYNLSAQIIINHSCTNLSQIPLNWINEAKNNLHIAYGHTSHGSQITDGMLGLNSFINNGGLNLNYPNNTFLWNNGGTNLALDLRDYAMDGDCGYYPQWVNNTINYLGPVDSNGKGSYHQEINVIIWSWCGQISSKFANGTLMSEYITPMNNLEQIYHGVHFVYMTGHVDHWDDFNNKAANNYLRNFCQNNQKILYDFADIESYDPDGIYYEFPNDNCDYYASANGSLLGNWAVNWQNSHQQNIEWYYCNSAHSEPLNANQKAYAAWYLWARLAGWNDQQSLPVSFSSLNLSNISSNHVGIQWIVESENNLSGYHIFRNENDLLSTSQRISSNLIIAQNTASTQTYSFIDNETESDQTYYYWIQSIDFDGSSVYHGPASIHTILYDNSPEIVGMSQLCNAYPNPFNPDTCISFDLDHKSFIVLEIFNCKGKLIKTINENFLQAGSYKFYWNGNDQSNQTCPSGIYFCRLKSDTYNKIIKLTLLK